jgi:hypothetical protein
MDDGFYGRGWAFPVRPGPAGGLALLGGIEKIRQSIEIILSTAPGERQMLPEFGCGIHDLVFQANTAVLRGLLKAQIREALTRWEPRIDVLDVTVTSAPGANNLLNVGISYRVRANNAYYNQVYPFYLVEGPG